MWFRVVMLVVCCLAVLRCAFGEDIQESVGRTEEVRRHYENEMSTQGGEELIKTQGRDELEFSNKRKENRQPSEEKTPEANNLNNEKISNTKYDEKEYKPQDESISQRTEETSTDISETEISTNSENETTQAIDVRQMEKEKVCFNYVGCFDMRSPWSSTLRKVPAPDSPENIAASIRFYSRPNLEEEVVITLYPKTDMKGAKFDPQKPTAIMIHGFASDGSADWLKEMKNAYLEQVDGNVMVVDWGNGAQKFNYFQVAANTRLVARQLEIFINQLIQYDGADLQKFHLIGHSLGAHICSYLAKSVPGFRRLTALDPAQPSFEGFDKKVRLDASDADFVDVIHTDAKPFLPTLGFGMMLPLGDVDFYMNGGFDQPGCVFPQDDLPKITNLADLAKYPVEYIANVVSCPHGRSHEFFTEAIKKRGQCTFWGREVSVSKMLVLATNTVTQGFFKNMKSYASSDPCSPDKCLPLGLDTEKSPLRGVFVMMTGNSDPYCIPQHEKEDSTDSSFVDTIGRKFRPLNPLNYF